MRYHSWWHAISCALGATQGAASSSHSERASLHAVIGCTPSGPGSGCELAADAHAANVVAHAAWVAGQQAEILARAAATQLARAVSPAETQALRAEARPALHAAAAVSTSASHCWRAFLHAVSGCTWPA
eukprot:4164553-Prymnesium_polylepis.2